MLYLTKQNYLMYRLMNVTGKSRFLGGEAVLFFLYLIKNRRERDVGYIPLFDDEDRKNGRI